MTESKTKLCPLCGETYGASETKCPRDGSTLIELQEEVSLIGETLKGTYIVESKVGAGGMGVVFSGTQQPLGRRVAIKTLLPGMQRDSALVRRFFREAQLLSALNHPNVVQVFDCGNTDSGIFFLVMEFMDGEVLQKLVPKGEGYPLDEVVALFVQICAGVQEAHHRGLVHRDLKPSNVFVVQESGGQKRAKVFDFGLARRVEGQDTQITQAGMVMGTPGYVAPEQLISDAEPDTRCDIYALGAILYFMLSGRNAYRGKTAHSVVAKQLSEAPEMAGLLGHHIPAVMPAIVRKAMARKPEDRYETVDALADAVRRWKQADASTDPLLETVAVPVPDDRDDSLVPTVVDDTPPSAPVVTQAMPEESGPTRRGLLMGLGALGITSAAGVGWYLSGGATEGGDAGTRPDAAAAPPPVPPAPIKFGMTAPFSGPSEMLGRELRAGLKAGFMAINAAGGVGGRELELTALDDGYEPERAQQNVQRFIDEGEILGLVGCVGTPTARLTVPMAVAANLPFLGAFSGSGILREDPPQRYVVNYRASYEEETAAMVRYFLSVKRYDPSRIAVFAQADSYGDSGMQGVTKGLRAAGYLDTDQVLRVGYERNTLQVDDAVDRIWSRRRHIDAVIMVGTYRPCARFIAALKGRGADFEFANVSFVGSHSLAEELHEIEPGSAEGVLVTQVVPHPLSEASGVREYREVLARYQPQERPGFVSLEGYIVATLIHRALQAASEVSAEGLIDGFESIRELDIGIGATLSYGPSDHQGSDRVWGTRITASGEFEVLASL